MSGSMSGLRFALDYLCLKGEAVQPGEPFITLQSRRHHHVASAWVSKRDGRGLEAMIGTHKHGGASLNRLDRVLRNEHRSGTAARPSDRGGDRFPDPPLSGAIIDDGDTIGNTAWRE